MSTKILIIISIITIVIGRRHRYGDHENRREKGVKSSIYQTTSSNHSLQVNDAVIEKFVDILMESEKHLKRIDKIDAKMNEFMKTLKGKSNLILKHLNAILDSIKLGPQKDINKLHKDNGNIETKDIPTVSAEGGDNNIEPHIDERLSALDTNVKSVMAGVESIVSIISEVKNRQYMKSSGNLDVPVTGSAFDTMTILNEFRKSLHEQKTKKCDCKGGRVDRSERYPSDCFEIQLQGFNVSGIYKIKPEDIEPFYVLCDLNSAGGGWTVFQNRFDGSQDFYKGWSDYKYGFGNLAGEFWLGLEKLHFLTNQKLYEMRIEVETQLGQDAYASYSVFTIGPEYEGFRISSLGTYYGTAGDSFTYHAGQKFSTVDMDNDQWKEGSCAAEHGGAWWYKECDKSNLNGKYSFNADENRGQTIYWISFKGPNFPLSKTRMMIRPLPASKPVNSVSTSRKIPEFSQLRSLMDKKPTRKSGKNDFKGTYELSRAHPHYRYEDTVTADAFFPGYP